MGNKVCHIISGGTVFHVRPHFAFCAPAYGLVGIRLFDSLANHPMAADLNIYNHTTRMANSGLGKLETNDDISNLIDQLVADPATKIVIMASALCDFEGFIDGQAGKELDRLQTREVGSTDVKLVPAKKIVGKIRQKRKDIFAVAFKATTGFTIDEQYIAGLRLLKEAGVNLVLANDLHTKVNMVITPEEAKYHVGTDRQEALEGLVDMTLLRSQLTFTRSTVVDGERVSWTSQLIPQTLREVVGYCVLRGAYKPFLGATVGHFACKLEDNVFLTSIRKTNFNDLPKLGMVRIVTDGPDSVLAFGAKPSVGGQSQRIIFSEHPEYDCIVHFHCPLRPGSEVPEVSQRAYECGSHECGKNTSRGLRKFGNLSAVYLKDHGPNIVFSKDIDPFEVIQFIEANFDLEGKTGGYVQLGPILE